MTRLPDATLPETRSAKRFASDVAELPRPDSLPNRYQLVSVIGSGGMGRVYRAHDDVMGRDVAIKVIDLSTSGTDATQPRERFVREAQAAARLAHPNIVAVHDVDAEAGWLVMDLVAGETLRDRMQRGPVPPHEVRRIAEQVLSALDAAHSSGVIHRDIKPSNILIDTHGKITLVDFGVARLVDVEMTRTGESLGTPAYMAPEQLRGGKVDARTDLYGLAATMYELVSGQRMTAFESPSASEVAAVVRACGTEHGLAQVIELCLQPHAEERIASAREAQSVLARPRRRRRAPWIAGVVALAAVAGGAGWMIHRPVPVDRPDPRKAVLFSLMQHGEHDKAAVLLDAYVAAHPTDPDAREMVLLNTWWQSGRLLEPLDGGGYLRPAQRDMLHGISLLSQRHEDLAIAYLEDALRRQPDSTELSYALGEAYWHGQQLERGAELLSRVFERDPHWQMALHHVLELRLSRRETALLRPLAAQLKAVDPARAAALDCEIAIADRKPHDAVILAQTALATVEPLPELYTCLMEAQILDGGLAAAEASSAQAQSQGAIDLREWGTRAVAAELLLYRGRFDEYLSTVNGYAERQRILALALWRPKDVFVEEPMSADAIRGQPIVVASQLLVQHVLARDPVDAYERAPEVDLRLYGRGLAAELHGDTATAVTNYRQALASPSKGDTRMLIAYQLAHTLHSSGDEAGARSACDEIIAPSRYEPYRALLLPDCLLWSGDPVRWRELTTMWTGDFEHPAVVEARGKL